MNLLKFSSRAKKVISDSQTVASQNGNLAIEPEHLLKLLMAEEGVVQLLQRLRLNTTLINTEVDACLKALPKGTGQQYLSISAIKALACAEAHATRLGERRVNPGHMLIALSDAANRSSVAASILSRNGVTAERLEAPEARQEAKRTSRTDSPLKQYAIDLVHAATTGSLPVTVGRDEEIRKLIQILSRKSKNNPVLIGKPGVGKNAIINGLAHRIAAGDVPISLRNRQVWSLDLSTILAGTSLRGQFEERMKSVITEIKASNGNIILFIDEIHTIVGAGGEGASDASQMFKPPLARGEIQVLGATTPEEFRRSIAKDKALERRFQEIFVEEPTAQDAIRILRGVRSTYEVHHGVKIQDAALAAAVHLSQRYVTNRQLPDKALDLIDEAASRLRISADSMPEKLDIQTRQLVHLKMEYEAISGDRATAQECKDTLLVQIAELSQDLSLIRQRWQSEVNSLNSIRAVKAAIIDVEAKLEIAERHNDVQKATDLKYSQLQRLNEELIVLESRLTELQAGTPLIREDVEPADIASVIADLTGIPVAAMMQSEREKLVHMEDLISQRLIGQKEAIESVARAVRRSRSGLSDPNRPVGSFFFLGPSGVGKTELAKALTEFLFNDESAIIRLDMSEFQEKHTVSRLIGSPPGYKGSDDGGQLTEAVKRKPYSIVLFDEVEKAHPDIFDLLLQVLDDGRLTDSQSNTVDFRNTVIIMTSNVGSRHLLDSSMEHGHVTSEAKDKALEELKMRFRPEFLGRIDDVVMFHGLTKENCTHIARLQVDNVRRLLAARNMQLTVLDSAFDALVEEGFEPKFGARPLRRAVQRLLQDPLSMALLDEEFVNGDNVVADHNADAGFIFSKV